jgi:hypothetical protein
MSIINAPTLLDTQYSGDAPFAVAHGAITLAAAPSGHRVRLVRLFAGTRVHDVKMVNAALGGSTTVALGFEYVNGEAGGSATAFLAATSTAAAATTRSPSAPVTLEFDAFIIATIGGAAATGALSVQTFFEFEGK